MKKFFAVLMALVLVLSMGVTAFAAGTGTITITNAVDKESYTVYKMFDFVPVDDTKGRYTANEKWTTFINGEGAEYLEFDNTAGTIKFKGEETDERKAELAKKAVKYAQDNSVVGTTLTANGTTVEFTNLDLGYYAIDTSLGTLCALTTTNKDAQVTEKNTTPNIDKKIVEDTNLVDANNVAIGDEVKYQSVVTAGKGTVNYVIHDKMSAGLTFKNDVVIKNGDYTLEANTDYTLTTNCEDGCTFEIDLTPEYEETLKENNQLVITYSATLNDGAVIGNTGNPNEIQLTYGNAQKTLWDTVITYTTKLTINKFETVDGKEIPLKGAGFTLYKDGEAIGTEIKGKNLTTFVWTGLEEGTYVLKETTVPVGYNPVKDITIVITCEEPEKVNATTDTAVWDETKKEITLTNTNGAFEGKVENKTGTLLPETGGIGTTIFYIVGITLMLGAAILLISKKKMAAKA